MAATWVFPPTAPYQVQGRDLSEDNFAQEEKTNLEILIREVLQNPIDARASDNEGPVRVRIKILTPGNYDADYLARLLGAEFGARLEASGGDPLPDPGNGHVLVIEDFGTTGLEGTWENPDIDGSNENWNAFWHREGEGAKSSAGSNGRAGQGKITYYRISAARCVFGLTVRKSDGQRLLMGRSAFRKVYPFEGRKFLRHSFWCEEKGHAHPVMHEEEIMAFRKAFGLSRLSEPGLSLVIPFPTDFLPKGAIQTIITDFYYPVAARHLEVEIGGLEITAGNIDNVANQELPDDEARKRKSPITKGFRQLVRKAINATDKDLPIIELKASWSSLSSIPQDALAEGDLERLRNVLESGELISVRLPVAVRPKKAPAILAYFEVHIEVPEDIERTEEAYIRRDLLIGAEAHLGSSTFLQKARALTLIRDANLSAFLADAEEPTHLKWNGSRPRLAEDYSNAQATLRAVRQAAPRLLALVSNGLVKHDLKALAKYFTKPAEEGKRNTAGGKKEGGKNVGSSDDAPPPVRKPFRIVTGEDCVRIMPNGSASPPPATLPSSCVLELAYEGLDQDPFRAYDPFDFDLADTKEHPLAYSGINLIECSGNRLRFDVNEPDFFLEVPGFDPNIRLRARLSYKESTDGTPVSEE